MGVGTKEAIYFWCERCGHQWFPRDPNAELPKVCPNGTCKSPYWNRPRKDQASEEPTPARKKVAKKRAKKKG